MKKTIFTLSSCLLIAGAASAATTVFDDHFDNSVLGTDVNGVNGGFEAIQINAVNLGQFVASEAGTLGTHNATGTNNRSGIISTTAFDVSSPSTSFTVTWVVDSYEASAGNGFRLELSSTASAFDTTVQFILENGSDDVMSINVGGTQLVTDTAIASSTARADGFTLTATFDATGITYSAVGLGLTGGSEDYASGDTYASLFDSTMFVGGNIQASGGTDAQFVLDRITVTAVPEPGSYALMAGLLGLNWVMLRRRQA